MRLTKSSKIGFALLVCLVVAATGLGIATNGCATYYCVREFNRTFVQQEAVALQQREVTIAQEYANKLANIADLEANRAHELDEKLKKAHKAFLGMYEQHQQDMALTRLQVAMLQRYIDQLTEYIEANELPVPLPQMEMFSEPIDPSQIPRFQIEIEPEDDREPILNDAI